HDALPIYERKIDFELISGGTQGRGAPADGGRANTRNDRSGKGDKRPARSQEPNDADVRKSREIKKALLAEAKTGKPASSGKAKRNSAKPKASGKPAADGAPRKRKAKS